MATDDTAIIKQTGKKSDVPAKYKPNPYSFKKGLSGFAKLKEPFFEMGKSVYLSQTTPARGELTRQQSRLEKKYYLESLKGKSNLKKKQKRKLYRIARERARREAPLSIKRVFRWY